MNFTEIKERVISEIEPEKLEDVSDICIELQEEEIIFIESHLKTLEKDELKNAIYFLLDNCYSYYIQKNRGLRPILGTYPEVLADIHLENRPENARNMKPCRS